MIATIIREKQYSPKMSPWRVAWKWLYTVVIPGLNINSVRGYSLAEARGYAKRKGATTIVESWRVV